MVYSGFHLSFIFALVFCSQPCLANTETNTNLTISCDRTGACFPSDILSWKVKPYTIRVLPKETFEQVRLKAPKLYGNLRYLYAFSFPELRIIFLPKGYETWMLQHELGHLEGVTKHHEECR